MEWSESGVGCLERVKGRKGIKKGIKSKGREKGRDVVVESGCVM